MSEIFDKLFRHSFYKKVLCSWYAATEKYKRGYEHFLSKSAAADVESYEFKKTVHNMISDIRISEEIIFAAEKVRATYPKGMAEFEDIHNGRFDEYDFDFLTKVAMRQGEVKRYHEIITTADEIIDKYREEIQIKFGLLSYVLLACYNKYSPNIAISFAQQLVDSEEDLRRLHIQKHEEEKRKKYIIARARDIYSKYPDEVRNEFDTEEFESVSWDKNIELAQKIVNAEDMLRDRFNRRRERELKQRLKKATKNWLNLPCYRFAFFYWYYPKRFVDISEDSKRARRLIYDFKDGVDYSEVAEMVEDKIVKTFEPSDLSSLTFVCIPASSECDNILRYESFSEELCSDLGMRNGFEHIRITKEKTPSHLGGNDRAEYEFDDDFFKGANVILFDDVMTHGNSLQLFKAFLEARGANIVCALTIGVTYREKFPLMPHPYTGRI